MNYNTLPINDLHIQQILVLVHKFLHHNYALLDVFTNCFTVNKLVHGHNTRSKDDIHMYYVNLTLGQKCLTNKAGSLWNSLPSYLKCPMSTEVFNQKLRNYIYSIHHR